MNLRMGETSHGKYWFWDGDWLGAKTAYGEFLDSYYLPYMDALRPGQVMIDVGAHIGTFTIYLAIRGVLVKSFEASPEVFTLLEKNVAENNLGDLVSLYNLALYDRDIELAVSPECAYKRFEDGKLDYASTDCSGWLWLVPGTDVYGIRARTLDSFSFENVALIKVDAEGCDLRVLQGAEKTIKDNKPVLCFEYNEKPALSNGYALSDLLDFVTSLGYLVIEVKKHGEQNRDFVGVPQ